VPSSVLLDRDTVLADAHLDALRLALLMEDIGAEADDRGATSTPIIR